VNSAPNTVDAAETDATQNNKTLKNLIVASRLCIHRLNTLLNPSATPHDFADAYIVT
jgi:hypothetical protein